MTDTPGGFTVDLEALERALLPDVVTVLLLCNPHNPTGRVLTREELSAIDRLAARHGVIVVSDEIHAELVYTPRQHTVTATVSPTAATRTVTLQSATKAFNLGSLRCGFVHFGSEELQRRFDRVIPDRLLGRVSGVSIAATVAAWLDGDDWLDQVRHQLAVNRDRVTQWVAAQDGRVDAHAPEATYFSWMRLHGFSGEPAADVLLRKGRVALHPGQQFAPECSSWVRLNFATTPRILDDILARVSTALRTHQVSSNGGNS
jgi:cystathionine beta-lyase